MKKKILLFSSIIFLIFLIIFLIYNLNKEVKTTNYINDETAEVVNTIQNNYMPINTTSEQIDNTNIPGITKYVALGDSITLGTGLENIESESYIGLLSKSLNASGNNHSIDGMNSSWLLYNIEQGKYASDIKNANLITVSVGSNDILWIFYQLIADAFNIKIEGSQDLIKIASEKFEKATLIEKYNMISNLYKNSYSEETRLNLDTAIEKYKECLPKLVKNLKKSNPSSELVLVEYYNPYHNMTLPLIGNGFTNFGAYLDSYIDNLNQILYDNENLGYTIAHIKDEFYKTNSTNVSISPFNFSLDPHPNKIGHKIIYEKILEILNTKNSR